MRKIIHAGVVLMLFFGCSSTAKIDHIQSQQFRLNTDAYTTVDSSIIQIVAPYKSKLDAEMDVQIATNEQALEKNQPEGLLGDFVSDLCLSSLKEYHQSADFCVFNNGGLRAALPKGVLTKRNVFEVMPFENELEIVQLDGLSTKQLFNYIAAKGGVPVSGVRMKIKGNVVEDVKINNTAFDSTKTYRVLTSDYLANGGDNLSFLADKKREYVGVKIRDVILNYLINENKKGNTINVKLDGRISY